MRMVHFWDGFFGQIRSKAPCKSHIVSLELRVADVEMQPGMETVHLPFAAQHCIVTVPMSVATLLYLSSQAEKNGGGVHSIEHLDRLP
mmetsp:Transcript_107283/g.149575  ORF Transcript_107283/g.149575 Transcript_107283/m.149575 type:complete len:88 (+) Transcript_107283:790-1053(+)